MERSSRYSRSKKILFYALLAFLLYLAVGGGGIFLFLAPPSTGYEANPYRFYSEHLGPDRLVIVEERVDGAVARINLLENAQSSIDIAYYAVHDGISSDIFYGLLVEAAERGVTVRLLLDGIFHNLRGGQRSTLQALLSHPNITVAFYEPLNLLQPWTLNNRLHDKIMIIDGKYALIGGRNIGDKYYVEKYDKPVVKDRDVLIINEIRDETSVLREFERYFSSLFSHHYTKHTPSASGEYAWLIEGVEQNRAIYPARFIDPIDWISISHPTNAISLVTNPITRMKKEPTLLMELLSLFSLAQDAILIQSPYIIPTGHMNPYYRGIGVTPMVLTNSAAASPNPFAAAGYLSIRRSLDSRYEYYGDGSIHAKTYIVDSRISVVGSFNLDSRSSFLSTESVVVIDSEPVAEALTAHIAALGEQSLADQPALYNMPFWKKPITWVMRLLIYPFHPLL